jgi:high affinity Mn2+ porin
MKFIFNFRRAACLLWSALALLLAILALHDISRAQDPAESETKPPGAAIQPGTMFNHQVGENLWIAGQANFIFQTHPGFDAPYSGPNSLQSEYDKATSGVMTLFTGYKFSHATEALVDVEEAGGHGLSQALGIAGFTNLDAVRNPSLGQAPYIARAMFHGVLALSSDRIETDPGPFSTFSELPARRLELRAGKFGMVDFLDVN